MKPGKWTLFGVPIAVAAIVVMLVVPIPSALLDVFISINITFAVLVLMMAIRVNSVLEFSAFPSVLLIATVFRLALNITATRLVLLHGFAGSVIQSFGNFVVGGSLVVGLVVFFILFIVQFVVITNGAGRVAEVAARFTLDAMPGKQMAIDADLNAGHINEQEARKRREKIAKEADFYGAMDGASKFVKGDAIAAVIITLINLVGGFAVGVLQKHLSLSQAISTYSLLSVGDGLVSQIPALLLSVSTGLIVTRSAGDSDFGFDLLSQFRSQTHALRLAGGIIAGIGILPGLPKVPFLLVGTTVFFLGRRAESRSQIESKEVEAEDDSITPLPIDTPETLISNMKVEPLTLELAVDLLDLLDPTNGGDLLDRVRGLRRKIANELGLILPPVRTKDNIDLPINEYAIAIHEVEVARGRAPQGRSLAIGGDLATIPGEYGKEPVFGLDAKWIPTSMKQQAIMLGATVVDRSSVITTHISEIVKRHAGELISRQQVKELIEAVKKGNEAVVEEMTSVGINLSEVQRTLKELLEEQVPIRDLSRILEAITERARISRDPDQLLEAARIAVGPSIVASKLTDGELPIITLDPYVAAQLQESLKITDAGLVLGIEPTYLRRVIEEAASIFNDSETKGKSPILLVPPRLRTPIFRAIHPMLQRISVLSTSELGGSYRPNIVGVVNVANASAI